MSSELAGRFLPTGPPGKSTSCFLLSLNSLHLSHTASIISCLDWCNLTLTPFILSLPTILRRWSFKNAGEKADFSMAFHLVTWNTESSQYGLWFSLLLLHTSTLRSQYPEVTSFQGSHMLLLADALVWVTYHTSGHALLYWSERCRDEEYGHKRQTPRVAAWIC